jgi:hypothetical protein
MRVKCMLCFNRNIQWSHRELSIDCWITPFEVHGSRFAIMDDG